MKIKYPWGYILGLVLLAICAALVLGVVKWWVIPNLMISLLILSVAINVLLLLPLCDSQARGKTVGYWQEVLRALRGSERQNLS